MNNEILYLSNCDVKSAGVSLAEIIDAVEFALLEKYRGNVVNPPKVSLPTRAGAAINAMPAYLKSCDAVGMKWVSRYADNQRYGLPAISGLVILNNAETGRPLSIMDASWLTAMRTGAAAAVAAKYLALPDAQSIAILGCGVQGRASLEAVSAVLKRLERVYLYDTLPEVACQLRQDFQLKCGAECKVCTCAEEAVRPADVVITAGPIRRPPSPVILPDWLKRGCFVCALDLDAYVTPAALCTAELLLTDDLGQLLHYKETGYFAGIPEVLSELAEVVGNPAAGRKTHSDRIISIQAGLAVEDLVVAQLTYQRALKEKIGTRLQA